VLHGWHPEENWWSGTADPAADVEPFADADAVSLLTRACGVLTGIDVRVPAVLHVEHRGGTRRIVAAAAGFGRAEP